jgi:hypothetical protein
LDLLVADSYAVCMTLAETVFITPAERLEVGIVNYVGPP